MKNIIFRLLSLLLVLFISIGLFAGCQNEKLVTKTDVSDVTGQESPVVIELDDEPFSIAKTQEGTDLIILTPGANNTVEMTVADGTTLSVFLQLVTSQEGYSVHLFSGQQEITDLAALVTHGMTFRVIKDESGEAEIEYPIVVASKTQIEATVSKAEQQKLEQQSNLASGIQTPNASNAPGSSLPSSSSVVDAPQSDDVLYGKDIILGTLWKDFYQGGDALSKAWQSRFQRIKKEHNCDTEILQMDASSVTDMIVKEVMAGKATADLYEVSISTSRDTAKKGAAANLRQSKTIDWKVYETSATACTTFSGKSYGVAFDGMGANPMGIFYNKEIVKKYAPEYDIEQLYREKKWTFDVFTTIASKCTQDTDGDGKTDIYGLINNGHLVGMALAANAGGTATMGANGRVQAALCSQAGIEALEWCKGMVKSAVWKYTDDTTATLQQFANGQSAFLGTFFHFYATITDNASFSYGFVPTPIGPQRNEYTCNNYDGRVYMVPKTKESRLDEIGIWLNEAALISSQMVNITVTQMARNGFDSTAQEVYRWIVKNMSPEYACFGSEVDRACTSAVIQRSKEPAQVMESIRSKAQKECDDAYAELY